AGWKPRGRLRTVRLTRENAPCDGREHGAQPGDGRKPMPRPSPCRPSHRAETVTVTRPEAPGCVHTRTVPRCPAGTVRGQATDGAVPASVAPLITRPTGAVVVEGGEGISVEARHMGQRAVARAPLADDDRDVLGARVAGDGVLVRLDPACRGVVVAARFHRGV